MSWPAAVPEHSKMNHSVARRPFCFANALIAALIALPSSARASSVSAAPWCAIAASLSSSTSMATTLAPNALRDLHAIAADAAGADDDGEAARRDAGAAHRLVGRGQRVGDDRHVGEREARAARGASRRLRRARGRARRCARRSRPGCRCPASSARGRSAPGRAGRGRIRRRAARPGRSPPCRSSPRRRRRPRRRGR